MSINVEMFVEIMTYDEWVKAMTNYLKQHKDMYEAVEKNHSTGNRFYNDRIKDVEEMIAQGEALLKRAELEREYSVFGRNKSGELILAPVNPKQRSIIEGKEKSRKFSIA